MDLTNRLSVWSPQVLSVLRIVVALLFIQHGMMKLFDFPPTGRFEDLELMSLIGLAGILEVFGGALLLVGLFTRPVAFILSGEMAFAYFIAHAPRDIFPILNDGNLAILYCFVFFYLVFAGGGAWSLDAVRRRQGGTAMATERD